MILKDNVTVIAFDADDTLWANQPYYDAAEEKFYQLLSDYGDSGFIKDELFRTEMQNMEELGYGAYIPFHTTWQHEQTEEFDHPRLFRLQNFEDLCGIL